MATLLDSIVVIRAAIAALGGTLLQVVLTTGFQELPPEFGVLPPNFHHMAYLPGRAMAERCDLMVHHGGQLGDDGVVDRHSRGHHPDAHGA